MATIKAKRTTTNYVYMVEIDAEIMPVFIKVTRCTARSNIYGLFNADGAQISAQEFKSALAAAKAYAVLIGDRVA